MTEREAKIKAKIDDLKKIITIQEELDEITKRKGVSSKKLTSTEQIILTDKLHKDAEDRKLYQEKLLEIQKQRERLDLDKLGHSKTKE